MVENMDVLGDRQQIIRKKILPTFIFFLLLLVRFLTFYEIEGIRVENGWGAPIHHKVIFVLAVFMFCMGIWMKPNNIVTQFLLPFFSLTMMLTCEVAYLRFKDYNLIYARIGFWLNIVISMVLLFYCLYISKKAK